MMQIYDAQIKEILSKQAEALEEEFSGRVIYYIGSIHNGLLKFFRDFIEQVAIDEPSFERLIFFLKTDGGSVEVTEVLNNLIRQHYKEVYFVIPDYAMSAGTILCMSGDEIYMDYSSSLGPIDPQILKDQDWVPVMGYIEKYQDMVNKAQEGTLSNAEFLILKDIDPAFLSRCEHACELAKTLVKEWLSERLLKNNNEAADAAAKKLADIKEWHAHGRFIGVEKLINKVGLPIEDYTSNIILRKKIRDYSDLLSQFVERNKIFQFSHSKNFF